MPPARTQREVVTTWFGTFVVEDGTVVRSAVFPSDEASLAARVRSRREGGTASEEDDLATTDGIGGLVSADRRLTAVGVAVEVRPGPWPELSDYRPPRAARLLRDLLLAVAARALRDAWDPAVHLEEAVRATAELDGTLNLLGERLASWASRDAPQLVDVPEERVRAIARALVATEGVGAEPEGDLPGPDPDLRAARRVLAQLYLTTDACRSSLERALEAAVPRRAPNLAGLLGPTLAARLIAQAGGLDRLAKLPASTIQVLGAERAFFEHLRGRAPPPRHGLLFLHPTVQGAPKRLRGKLARALAGKAAIAARRDSEGAGLSEELVAAYARRAAEVRTIPAKEHRRGRPGRGPSSST
jgi:nucleolar protein 56